MAVLVIFFQQMYPNIILSGSAATCALLIIYLHLQNRQISLDYLTNVPNRQELLNMLDLLLRRYPDKDFTLLVVPYVISDRLIISADSTEEMLF